MINDQFSLIVAQDQYKEYRIIIVRQDGSIEYSVNGSEWEWPEDKDRTEADGKSIVLLRDNIEKHYWTVGGVKTLLFPQCTRANRVIKDCYHCFKQFSGLKFPDHLCSGVYTFQCRVCVAYFTSQESLNDHFSKRSVGWGCQVCGKDTFYGPNCYQFHLTRNCTAPVDETREYCEGCNRNYLVRLPHNCNSFGRCKTDGCDYEFTSFQDRKDHTCYFASLNSFWEPVTDKKWESHWFYDFETTRGEDLGNNKFKHEVMAWAIKLMVPDIFTRLHIENENILAEITKLIDDAPTVGIQYKVTSPSIMVWGKELEEFMYFTEKIITNNKRTGKWTPVLWAHNGSKFDVKFILEHYLNMEGFDLAGDKYEQEFNGPEPEMVNGEIKWTHKKYPSRRKDVVRINMVGSKVLQMKVKGVTYRCSHAHHATSLRMLPALFGLELEVKKGEFPYSVLKRSNWGKIFTSIPPITAFDVDAQTEKRRKQIINWYNEQDQTLPWNFDEELWGYLFADVEVGCAAMEAYHEKSEELHAELWRRNPDKLDKHVSPLQKSTSPGWALQMYRTWFVPHEQIVILSPNEGKFVRDSLRGGRTDKRCNWMDISPAGKAQGDKIVYFDFKSLYPSVQKCSVHDTHFPVGKPKWIPFEKKGPINNTELIQLIGDKTGFVEISCKPIKYVTHPTLHRVGSYGNDRSKKLLFELDPKDTQVYAWPELKEAIDSGEIEVQVLHSGLLFDKGVDVFNEYVDFFFKVKDDAEAEGNEGLRSLAKLLLNSLWGKLGQRSYSTKEWVEYSERRDYLLEKFETGEYEMINCIIKDEHRIHFEYRIKNDLNNLAATACHIAAFVSMWGRVVLHKKLLREHGMRALYCDTDSAIVYLRGGVDTMRFTGSNLGDLTDEVPKMVKGMQFVRPYISQAVFLAPKTYGLEIKCSETDKVYHKVVCKGFEPSYANSKHIHFKAFKELVFTQYKIQSFMRGKREIEDVEERRYIRGEKRLAFVSSLARNEITPVEVYRDKAITGTYTKAQVHPRDPRFIVPFSKQKLLPPPSSFLTDRDHHFE